MKKIFALVFALIMFVASTCAAYCEDGKVRVTMLDIGQGDAFLIETPTQNVLLDTGGPESQEKLLTLLADIPRFEKLILTHPHADHIGNARAVLDNFPVDLVIDNGRASSSPLYRKYMAAVSEHQSVSAGDVIDCGNGVKFHVLNPDRRVNHSRINNQSIVGKLTFGDFAILFTGDAEREVEELLLDEDISATILKAGHHGSKTSNTEDFVYAVRPQFVLISAALGNKYGHPHKSALATFRMFQVPDENIFCTAFNGTVVVESDGFNCLVIPERVSDWVTDYTGETVTVTRID